MTFTLITAGGTIDKVYGTGLGVRDLHIGDPVVPKMLKQMLHVGGFSHFEACRKDSLDMDETDRRVICERILWTKDNHILISHGSDTMVETAQMIKKSLGISWKRVVLFGASQPASTIGSDAAARLGYALCALTISSEPGVIIAMDGIHGDPYNCRKTEEGVFCSFS